MNLAYREGGSGIVTNAGPDGGNTGPSSSGKLRHNFNENHNHLHNASFTTSKDNNEIMIDDANEMIIEPSAPSISSSRVNSNNNDQRETDGKSNPHYPILSTQDKIYL